jgi:dihydropteroate synthase
MAVKYIQSGKKKLFLNKPVVMGILNVTDDSFYDGGKYSTFNKAIKHALDMVRDGADIIDIGGESTGPGSRAVSAIKEIKRIVPLIKALRKKTDVWISADTYKSQVADEALKAGADMINDITALRGDPKMAGIVKKYESPIVIMYSKDNSPRTTIKKKKYKNAVKQIKRFFAGRIVYCGKNGIKKIIIDPGMGAFISGDQKYSLEVLKHIGEFKKFGFPVMTGPSRKSFIGNTLVLPPGERLEGSIACAVIAYLNGASVLRVHDVKETRRALDMAYAIIK